ncbi:hypothetical protein EX30DRAFT_366051 [Ascodesmis nigricans]|uniref:Uncharacterized protein n=1 Tax=Ascodesmis nigricans TaxID=341454 RepID=A0A4S2MMR0_9PEZI|nr:hypothetical protein EX30DRAFT_366051 [Ascodesmis nigricans]
MEPPTQFYITPPTGSLSRNNKQTYGSPPTSDMMWVYFFLAEVDDLCSCSQISASHYIRTLLDLGSTWKLPTSMRRGLEKSAELVLYADFRVIDLPDAYKLALGEMVMLIQGALITNVAHTLELIYDTTLPWPGDRYDADIRNLQADLSGWSRFYCEEEYFYLPRRMFGSIVGRLAAIEGYLKYGPHRQIGYRHDEVLQLHRTLMDCFASIAWQIPMVYDASVVLPPIESFEDRLYEQDVTMTLPSIGEWLNGYDPRLDVDIDGECEDEEVSMSSSPWEEI